MAKSTRIVCLANSRRPPGRCVAGKVIEEDGRIGGWIRPVPRTGGDGLSVEHVRDRIDCEPAHLDVVEIPTLQSAPALFQTENVAIDDTKRWAIVGRFDDLGMDALLDAPGELWLQGYSSGEGRNDRVPEQ